MLRRTAKKVVKHLHNSSYVPLNRIELSRSAVLSNVELVRIQNPGHSIIPVLKANAYGHGLVQMTELLNDIDCSFLAVDGYFEAGQIRDVTRHQILVMGYLRPENVRLVDTKKCSFVVQDIEGLVAFARLGKPVRIHLELNTGMNRLGLQPDELDEYLTTLREFPSLKLEGVMSHLADADNELDASYSEQQLNLFEQLLEQIKSRGFKPKFIHIAQTAGSVKVKSPNTNAIRLGIGLYGINPLAQKDAKYPELNQLKPVLELKSTIIKVLQLNKGDRVSYNGIFTAPKAMKIGILPLGYYEGLPRALSNVGIVLYQDKPLKIVGRVCMNHTMIELGDNEVSVGTEVTVFSRDLAHFNSINAICQKHSLFNYGLVTGLSSSIRRVIVP